MKNAMRNSRRNADWPKATPNHSPPSKGQSEHSQALSTQELHHQLPHSLLLLSHSFSPWGRLGLLSPLSSRWISSALAQAARMAASSCLRAGSHLVRSQILSGVLSVIGPEAGSDAPRAGTTWLQRREVLRLHRRVLLQLTIQHQSASVPSAVEKSLQKKIFSAQETAMEDRSGHLSPASGLQLISGRALPAWWCRCYGADMGACTGYNTTSR